MAKEVFVFEPDDYELLYKPIPTIRKFHESPAQIRAIVGPVGSAKTTGAALEALYYIPYYFYHKYKVTNTRGVIVRNTYKELVDTTKVTVLEWFPYGNYQAGSDTFVVEHSDGIRCEALFRSCDRPQDVKKFKSLEVTWYWIDESIEVPGDIKRMLKNRIGRFPKWGTLKKALFRVHPELRKLSEEALKDEIKNKPNKYPTRFGIETTNPPDVEHEMYSEFDWGDTPPPGPLPTKEPLKNHRGFWQPPFENAINLRPGYYDDLREDYKHNPDWIEMYVEGKPGVIVQGKLVYNNFVRRRHMSNAPLIWTGGKLYFGWDNSGNVPACVVVQKPSYRRLHVLAEFNHDKKNIIDFTKWVMAEAEKRWPGAEIEHWADPAGESKFSTKEGGFTSNAKLMREECAPYCVDPKASDQNPTARYNAVDIYLGMEDGILFDPSCTRLINGFLGGYCYPEIGTTGEYKDKPVKNKYSHIQDGLQYVLVKLALEDSLSLFPKSDVDKCAV